MEIDTSKMASDEKIEAIKTLIENEIKSGKLKNFDIGSIEILGNNKPGEYKGAIWLKSNADYPKTFTILAYDKNSRNWLLKLPEIQLNK